MNNCKDQGDTGTQGVLGFQGPCGMPLNKDILSYILIYKLI